MKKVFYKVVLIKDFDGLDISLSLHKDLIFDSLDEATKVAHEYLDRLSCSVKIFEFTSDLVACW